MVLFDVNVLVYAYRVDAINHDAYREWLEETMISNAAYGFSEFVLSGFLRVVTHPRIFNPPSPLEDALVVVNQVREQNNAILIQPGPRHWGIFTSICKHADARGNLIDDAYLAAMTIESGCEWITTDRDFSRFPGLNWRHPLQQK